MVSRGKYVHVDNNSHIEFRWLIRDLVLGRDNVNGCDD